MIYLDHAAATPVSKKALTAMLPYFSGEFFNPSAAYLPAKRVREAYEAAKSTIARAIGAKSTDLVITAGATESINLAFTTLDAVADAASRPRSLVLAAEHPAVLAAAKRSAFDLIKVNRFGLIDLADLRAKLADNVILVSVSLANNELGTIQPLSEIAEILRVARQDRLKRGITTPLYLHSDASQALNLLDLSVSRLGVDLLTLNAAKCGGPKGVGALYFAHDVKLRPITFGGGQERGLRSGTENVPGVVGFAAAIEECKKHLAFNRKQYEKMASVLRRGLAHTSIVAHISKIVNTKSPKSLTESIPEPLFLGNSKHQLANFFPVAFPGLDAERLIYKLERSEVYLSTGAACAANKGTKSHVLAAIGLSDSEIAGSLRISLGSTNTLEQVEQAAHLISVAVAEEYQRLALRGSGVTTRKSGATLRRQASRTRLEKPVADTPSTDGGIR